MHKTDCECGSCLRTEAPTAVFDSYFKVPAKLSATGQAETMDHACMDSPATVMPTHFSTPPLLQQLSTQRQPHQRRPSSQPTVKQAQNARGLQGQRINSHWVPIRAHEPSQIGWSMPFYKPSQLSSKPFLLSSFFGTHV